MADEARTSYYRTGEFARMAAVTPRTLRFYDRAGLLSPSRYSDSGYRLYSQEDLADLQQILALKFLGFSLEEIREFKHSGAEGFARALREQKEMLRDRRRQLAEAISAIERAEDLLARGERDWQSVTEILEVLQSEPKAEWVDRYFTPAERKRMEELTDGSYSDVARRKLAERPEWTEADQKRVDARYAEIASELRRLVAENALPDGAEAQRVAALHVELINEFTGGDPEVAAGLARFWEGFERLPVEERPPALPWDAEEGELLRQALDIYRMRRSTD